MPDLATAYILLSYCKRKIEPGAYSQEMMTGNIILFNCSSGYHLKKGSVTTKLISANKTQHCK